MVVRDDRDAPGYECFKQADHRRNIAIRYEAKVKVGEVPHIFRVLLWSLEVVEAIVLRFASCGSIELVSNEVR